MSQPHVAMTTASAQKKSKTNIFLWVLQGLLALLFLMAGFQKTFLPIDAIAPTITWVVDVPEVLVRFIGVSEFLGTLGLILPGITGIRPRLTVFAACGIGTIMIGAMIFHIVRGEFFILPMNTAFFALAAFLVYGRLRLSPFKVGK